jgi:hypothetical protein
VFACLSGFDMVEEGIGQFRERDGAAFLGSIV